MLSLLIASILLPSVLGNCCQPNVYEAIEYDDGEPNNAFRIVVNFNKSKVYEESLDQTQDDLKFQLFDIAAKKHYMMFKDESCSFRVMDDDAFDSMQQCTSEGTPVRGDFTIGNGVAVASYEFKGANVDAHLTVTKDTCLPVVLVRTYDGGDFIISSLFANVKQTGVDDSVLDQDLSSCTEEVDEVED